MTRHQDGVVHVGLDQGDLIARFTGPPATHVDELARLLKSRDIVDGDRGANRETFENEAAIAQELPDGFDRARPTLG